MEFFDHFSNYTKLPVPLATIKDHILETGLVSRIVRIPVSVDDYVIIGGYNLYRDATVYASNSGNALVAQIGYPAHLTPDWQRMVTVKEMLHILNPIEATASTRAKVDKLVDDLIDNETRESIGIPAMFDTNGMFHALRVLMPRDAIDELRPLWKKDPETFSTAKIAEAAQIPETFVKIALQDAWLKVLDSC